MKLKQTMETNRKTVLIALFFVLGSLAGFIFIVNSDDAPESDVTMVNTSENDEVNEPDDDPDATSTPNDAEDTDTDSSDTPKTPQLSGNVTEKPVIASSFGLVASSPVPDGQTVSTSCTSEPNVDCLLEFTNQDTDQIVQFEIKQTSANGIAIWEWEAGNELSSGTWSSVAKAADKISSAEVIYIQ